MCLIPLAIQLFMFVNKILKSAIKLAIQWFESNYVKLDQDECDFDSSRRNETLFTNVGKTKI